MTTTVKIRGNTSLEFADTSDFLDKIFVSNATFQNFHKICRFCLSFDDLKSFYDITYQQISLESIIFDCSLIKVDPDDGLPYNLCETCLFDLIRSYRFKKKCIRATDILQDAYNRENKEIAQSDNCERYDLNNFIIKEEEIEDVATVSNDYILEDMYNENFMVKNKEIHDVPTVCDNFEDTNSVNLIIKNEIEDVPIIQNDFSKNINSKDLLISNEKIDGTGNISNLVFIKSEEIDDNDNISDNTNTDNLSDNDSKNITIDNSLNSQDPLSKDCENKTTENAFKTITLKLTLYNSNTYSENQKTVENNAQKKTHMCMVCKKSYPFPSKLQRHMSIHTGDKPHKCHVCKMSFIYKSDLKKHMIVHTRERPYTCCSCQKSFTRKQHLNAHMRIHTGTSPFICGICKKFFTEKSSLNAHMLIHLGEKKHECGVCKRSFTQKSNYNRHMLIHTRRCPICRQSFLQKSEYDMHVLSHTVDRGFTL